MWPTLALLIRHRGIWAGTYTYLDAVTHAALDSHDFWAAAARWQEKPVGIDCAPIAKKVTMCLHAKK